MLEFLRKHQRYFFLVITVVIIISFSFFGTYSSMGGDNYREQVAFTAVDGTAVSRGELDQLVLFISTDADDKLLLGGYWGPNFLNNGVIRKDFLETGLAQLLVAQYPNEVAGELDKRLEKEKRFKLYAHPQASFLGVEAAWNYLAPGIKSSYEVLRRQEKGSTPEAFDTRVKLFLGERELPAPALHQLLRYQQRQYDWLKPDPNLDRTDLSLFGYHTLDDWFGTRFLRLVGEFIINSAKIAEQRGYDVSKQEALADLMRNSEISYRDNLSNPHIGVASGGEYFNEQLHRLSLDQNKAAQIWRQVLLFRRLFHDVGQAIFLDPQSLVPFNAYVKATVEGELYQLAPELRFNNAHTLQLFETYLSAISQRPKEGKALLTLPSRFLPVSDVTPELVQKRYLLDVAKTSKSLLQARVGVKESWNWEVTNWEKLVQEFPVLGAKKAATVDERFAILDSQDARTRARIDTFARQSIVNANPEWLEKALQEAEPQRMTVALPLKGGSTPFAGLKNATTLISLLDKAKLGEQDSALSQYSADGQTSYRIVVIDRSATPEIMTFAEAQSNGILENLLERQPKAEREAQWAILSKAIYEDYASGIAPEKAPPQLIDDVAASLRFYSYMREALTQLQKEASAEASQLVRAAESEEGDTRLLPARKTLESQWQLVKSPHLQERSGEKGDIDLQELFTMKPGSWSHVQTPVNGDLYFFQLLKTGSDSNIASLDRLVNATQEQLSDEAQQQLMGQLLEEIKAKKAISLDYLNVKEDEVEIEAE